AIKFATTAARGRHANRTVRSLFSGVLRCSQCGATVSRVSKGEHVYLVCAKANSRAGTHPYQAVRYALVEKPFRQWAAGIIADAPRTKDTDLEEKIKRCRVNLDGCEELVHDLVDERSLALRPAHSRCHQFVTRFPKASATSSPP